jgi:hypothetical protein
MLVMVGPDVYGVELNAKPVVIVLQAIAVKNSLKTFFIHLKHFDVSLKLSLKQLLIKN